MTEGKEERNNNYEWREVGKGNCMVEGTERNINYRARYLREGKKDQEDEERNGRFCKKGSQGCGEGKGRCIME
jgi:hypothetical protein